MPTFAIAIPNYNQSRYLGDALESLRHQNVALNAAVMDGGSRDQFESVIEQYRDVLAYVRSRPDEGQAAAILEGKQVVSGDIVAWLNADDYYFPGALDAVSAEFEKDPELAVVYGDAVHVTPEGQFLSYFPAVREYDPNALMRSCFICQPACFVRRSAYDRVGGLNPELVYTMDWDLWCRLAGQGFRFKYIRRPLAAVRCYCETKTLSGGWGRYIEIWRIESKYGRRLLPLTWPGFYYYDLSFGEKCRKRDILAYKSLEQLRRIKKRLRPGPAHPIHGFYPWSSLVEKRCRIRLPWYRRPPLYLHLTVSEADCAYRVSIGGTFEEVAFAEKGIFSVTCPPLQNPCIDVSIECLDKRLWALEAFSVAEAKDGGNNITLSGGRTR